MLLRQCCLRLEFKIGKINFFRCQYKYQEPIWAGKYTALHYSPTFQKISPSATTAIKEFATAEPIVPYNGFTSKTLLLPTFFDIDLKL